MILRLFKIAFLGWLVSSVSSQSCRFTCLCPATVCPTQKLQVDRKGQLNTPEFHQLEAPFNKIILSRLWDEQYLANSLNQQLPALVKSGDLQRDDLQARLDKVTRRMIHIEKICSANQFWMNSLLIELEDTGIWRYLFFDLTPEKIEEVYRFRQVARALIEASIFVYPVQDLPPKMIRLFAHCLEYLTFAYEQQIYLARLSNEGSSFWKEKLTYTEWLREDFIAQIQKVDLEVIQPEGSFMKAYSHPSLDFVVKVLQEGIHPGLKRTLDFEQDIEPKIILARDRLAGIAANTLVLENIPLRINGRIQVSPKALIQTKVVYLRNHFKLLAETAQSEARVIWGEAIDFKKLTAENLLRADVPSFKKMWKIVEDWIKLQRQMWERGIVDGDIQMAYNYGYDGLLDRICIFDFSNISDRREGVYWNEYNEDIFDRYRLTNTGFLSSFHPALGHKYLLEMYNLRDFNQFWQREYQAEVEDHRYALSDPGEISDYFERIFEVMMKKHHAHLEDTLATIASETMGINDLYSPDHPVVMFSNGRVRLRNSSVIPKDSLTEVELCAI